MCETVQLKTEDKLEYGEVKEYKREEKKNCRSPFDLRNLKNTNSEAAKYQLIHDHT